MQLSIVLILNPISTLFANEIENQYLFEKNISTLFKQKNSTYSYKRGELKINSYQKPSEFVNNEYTGYLHRPNSQIRHITKTKNNIIYDVIYDFDKWGHRVNLNSPSPQHKKFLFLYGCSFIYGNGLNTADSLNNIYNQMNSPYYSYNLAIGASGPHMLLAKLLSYKKIQPQISTLKKGQLIYFYYDDHIRRSNGLKYQSKGLNKSPYFNFDQKASPQIMGSFKEIFKYKHLVYKWTNQLFNYLHLDFTYPKINKSHVNYFCDILKASKKEFLSLWPDSQFRIIKHSFSKKPSDQLVTCLAEENIKILEPDFKTTSEDFIPLDGHPNRNYNLKLANFIKNLLH